MRRIFERWMPRIWTRLFLLTVLAVVLTWGVIALSVRALQEANTVITEIDTKHVPALTETSALAAYVAELAIQSNELLLATSTGDSALGNITSSLNGLLVETIDNPVLERETTEIVEQLEAVGLGLRRLRTLEAQIWEQVAQVRWLNLELEEESAALVADFTFNIQSQTRLLVAEEEESNRNAKALFLEEETRLRDSFLGLSAILTRLGSVAVQAANATSREQLDQLDDILSDSLAEVETVLANLSAGSEFLTLRQSAASMATVTSGPDGLIALRQDWVTLRNSVQLLLETSLNGLSVLQERLQAEAAVQRGAISATVKQFRSETDRKRSALLMATLLALAGGMAILFLYIRPVIIRPMQKLTNAMNAIAAGEPLDMNTLGEARRDEIGQLTNAVRSFRKSVRDRDQAISKLESTQSELVQAGKMAALGNLSAGIGHELNQPLGAIRQRLHMLQTAITSRDQDALVRQSGKIKDLVLRMEQIIRHLKKFARRSEHLKEEVVLMPLLVSSSTLMKASLAERQITLRTDPMLEKVIFLGDAVLVEQVIVNLLSNASDAIAETGKPGEIVFEIEDAPAGMISFSVADTGAGLGGLDPVTIVEPFVTSKDPGEGLGLGLSISYNILTGLGGDLAISKRVNNGLRVSIILPAAEGHYEKSS